MNRDVTMDLDTLAFGAAEALAALDKLAEGRATLPEEVYLARSNLSVLAASLAAMRDAPKGGG